MRNNGMEKIVQVVKSYNTNKAIINEVANSFLNKGLNKAMAKRIFANSERLHDLSTNELICFVESLYYATSNSSINPEKIFSQGELDDYHKNTSIKQVEYLPKNYDELGERELMKLEFLNDKYGNRNTKQHYYYLYLAHIKDEEDYLQRDLCEFSIYEIVDTMQGVLGSVSTKNNTLSFITKYLDYCVDKGIINANVLHHVNDASLTLVDKSSEIGENLYVDFDELISELVWLEKDEDNHINAMDIMIALLLRSGITNQEIARLKNSDFDYNKKIVTIRGNKGIKQIKLRDEVLHFVDATKNWDGIIPRTRFVMKTLDDHIIKLNGDVYDVEQALKSIKQRLAKFKKFGFRPLNENALITSKKIDMLDSIAQSHQLTTEDFQRVQEKFGNSKASYFKLKTDYEMCRGDENILLGKRGKKATV